MIRIRKAIVDSIIEQDERTALINVKYDNDLEKAINYNHLSGSVDAGDTIFLNTTASYLNLGTGGYSFVIINQTKGTAIDLVSPGEIMKLRYTPYQINCRYPTDMGYTDIIKSFKSLDGMIVLTGELHSMLAPAACLLKYYKPDINIAYIMTDGGCLPMDFSNSVKQLKEKCIIAGTISSGNSFGGDFESVNIYDALVIAHSVLKCDIAIITMGPGILGTGTMYGFTGIEQGYIIDCINTLHGFPIFIPRISFNDSRERHYGISHHTLTVLTQVAKTRANVVLPVLDDKKHKFINNQMEDTGISNKHSVIFIDGSPVFNAMDYFNIIGSTMGRDIYSDKEFFLTCGASAIYTLGLLLQFYHNP